MLGLSRKLFFEVSKISRSVADCNLSSACRAVRHVALSLSPFAVELIVLAVIVMGVLR
jgi:hypothetical protein